MLMPLKKVEQVRFHDWADPEAPRYYWSEVTTLARFISLALAGDVDPKKRVSTIGPGYYKEKFGLPIVWCHLADTNLVSEAYAQDKGTGPVTAEYAERCLMHDSMHYRQTYLSMMGLVPHYREILIEGSVYRELLFARSRELTVWCRDAGEHYLKRWCVTSTDELQKKLAKACGF